MTSIGSTGFRPAAHPGVAYKARGEGGMLVLYDSHQVRIFCNGPRELPWAAEKTADQPRWVRTRGGSAFTFRQLMEPVREHRALQAAALHFRLEAPARPRAEAYAAFLSHFHPAHLNEIADYRLRAFNFYCAIRRCPGLFDIVCSGTRHDELAGGGALAYALSNVASLVQPTPRRPFDLMRRLVRRKRRDIAIALGFPAQHAALAVNVMGRMPRCNVTNDTLRALRTLLTQGDALTRKRLAHCDRVSEAFLYTLEGPDLACLLTPSLLEELSHALPGSPAAQDAPRVIADTVRLLQERGARIPKLHRYADVVELHDGEIARAIADYSPRASLNLPPAPVREIPGHIEYVSTSTSALDAEGRTMHNCVGSYARLVARGERFIYRVLQPERCTLAITLGSDLRFHIHELKGPCNTEPKCAETWTTIQQWLRDSHDPRSVERVLSLLGRSVAIAGRQGVGGVDLWDLPLPRHERAVPLEPSFDVPL